MNTKLLKQKILDLAIRGKLTQQLKSDGTAADLLTQISDERRETRDERKGTRSKKSGVILSEAQSAKSKDLGRIIPLDKNEAPFEIPENWEWVRLGDVCELISGQDFPPEKYNAEKKGLPYITGASNFVNNHVILNRWTEYPSVIAQKGDILLVCKGSGYGNYVYADFEKAHIARQIMAIRISDKTLNAYVYNFLGSQYERLKFQGNGLVPGIARSVVLDLTVPLPPLAEQQRIVAKIEEAFAEIDAVEKNKELLKTHIKQTRQKILDLAIHGKLVPQDKNDEPASVLLERITRDNPHYEKIEDEPFEIPQNWVWCKLGNLFFHTTGKALKKANSTGIQRNYITTSNLYWCEFDLSEVRSMYFTEDELDKCTAKKGDLLLCNGGDVGRAAIWNFDYDICFQNHISRLRPKSVSLSNVFYLYVIRYNKEKGNLNGRGVGITSLSANDLLSLVVPLPPLAEQSRIVAKIEELFSTLDQMERNLI